jgi:hypothetical protein
MTWMYSVPEAGWVAVGAALAAVTPAAVAMAAA